MATTIPPSEDSGLDLERELDLAEVLLGSQDMTHVLQLFGKVPQGMLTDPGVILASFGIITAYCRSFTTNDRRHIPGKRWILKFSPEEHTLHRRVLELRHNDVAHSSTSAYPGRVHIHIQEVGEEIRYSNQMSIRGLTREDLHILMGMVSKIREQIAIEQRELGQAVLRDRVKAGYTGSFALGAEDSK